MILFALDKYQLAALQTEEFASGKQHYRVLGTLSADTLTDFQKGFSNIFDRVFLPSKIVMCKEASFWHSAGKTYKVNSAELLILFF
jgi:hypothetical protein